MNYPKLFDQKIRLVEERINQKLIQPSSYDGKVIEAMAYSIQAGGKRIRPVYLMSCCEAAGGKEIEALDHAVALEMIHTYSLIHDDLPAMDDDDFRRGKPSSHKQFGEAIAILAGDGLLNLSYEVLLEKCGKTLNEKTTGAAAVIASAAGVGGMIGGQCADILWEGKTVSADALEYIHQNKTAALISAAFKAGAILGGAGETVVKAFEQAGNLVGHAFQIQDDVLDETGSADELGKPVHSDREQQKTTAVTVYGLETAIQKSNDYLQKAVYLLKHTNMDTDFVVWLTENLFDRNK